MSTSTATPTVRRTEASSTSVAAICRSGAVAGLGAAVAATAVAAIAKIADVPMQAAPSSEAVGRDIPLTAFAVFTVISTVLGVAMAVLLARWARRPARTFVVVASLLTVASFALPSTAGHATTATKLVLDLTHVVAAVIVIPVVAARLPKARPRTP